VSPPSLSEKRTTVLFIDDDEEDLNLWSKGLIQCSAHYSILQAKTVKAGLELFERNCIDCVLLDLDLPHESGFEVLIALLAERKQLLKPVIVLTRLYNPVLREMTLGNGACEYVIKHHSSPQTLHEAIQKAIGSVGECD
jgi:CheY-like chemotaxis protein